MAWKHRTARASKGGCCHPVCNSYKSHLMKPRIVVVGSYMQDLSWRCAAFPRPGESVIGSFASGPGGKGSNQAVAAGRLGVPTLFVGAVGRDAFAAQARAFYRAEGIAARLTTKPRQPTGNAAILVEAAGQNEIIIAPGANLALSRADVPVAAVRGARVVVVQLESNLATTAWVLREARKASVTTVLNTAPMHADLNPAILRHADIVIPNETEFVALVNLLRGTGVRKFTESKMAALNPAKLHALCRKLGAPTVIITRGEKGCFLSHLDDFGEVPAFKVTAVDTTGAGDAFVGGFAAGLVANNGDLLAAARFGNAVAALSVTRQGTSPAMPTARQVAAFLRKHA